MAFTTVTGSDGITSLVGTTGVDTATIVTLNDKTFVGGNTGNDTVVTNSGTGSINLTDFNIRMGGGADGFVNQGDNILNSFISLDGETLANDGSDSFVSTGTILDSEVVGRGGNDSFTLGNADNSIFNGNTGNDNFLTGGAVFTKNNERIFSNVDVFGGQGTDTMTLNVLGAGNEFFGNKGSDVIAVTSTTGTLSASAIYGGQGTDTLTLNGTTIDGNILSGDLGSDVLNGSAGSADILLGGDGADTLRGNAGGVDSYTGGTGTDTFIIDASAVALTRANATVIDYTGAGTGIDTIQIAGLTVGAGIAAGAATVTALTATTVAGGNLAGSIAASTAGNAASFGGLNTIALTYTPSGAGNEFAGTYILSDTNGDNTFTNADAIVQVNSLTGLATQLTYIA